MLYNPHFLRNVGQEFGKLTPPSLEEVATLLKDAKTEYYGSKINFKNYKECIFEYELLPGHEKARLDLVLIPTTTEYSKTLLCRIYISSTPANCSAIFLSQFSTSYKKKGLGTVFFKEVMKYAQTAGYSFIYCNAAGEPQINATKKLVERFEFQQLGPTYRNPRSSNKNIWFYKVINSTEIEQPSKLVVKTVEKVVEKIVERVVEVPAKPKLKKKRVVKPKVGVIKSA